MITGGTLPTYPAFETSAVVNTVAEVERIIDRGDHTEIETTHQHSLSVVFDGNLPFSISTTTGRSAGLSVWGAGRITTTLQSAYGQTRQHQSILVPKSVTTRFGEVKPDSLTAATRTSYVAAGTLDPRDTKNNLLPGIDLTFIGDNRAAAITPREIAQAWHTRGAVGRTVTFTDRNGVQHQRTITETSQQLGDDLVIQRLNEDLPDTITPAKVFPDDVEDYFSLATFTETVGFVAYRANRLSAGSFFFNRGLWDLQNTGEPSWIEAVSGDSGSTAFVVVHNQPVVQGGKWNDAEQCTAVHNHLDAIRDFCSHPLSVIDLSEYPRVN